MTGTIPTPAALAADWIACGGGRMGSDRSSGLAQLLLTDFPHTEPQLVWDTILLIVKAYPAADLYCDIGTEAQTVCGALAAGPVEDLLSLHGQAFIDRFEREARADRRVAWVLGGVWRLDMCDEIWNRVRNAADDSYWNRTAARNMIGPD
ncbi:DUF6869 domain-containing protein [uncultured Sphingomonas sp.]|uniref:DUF6869 domain-containing protein n=1 Tax=uncultured Sphingomonas sp. TaxID=158754 RepID=UPI0025854B88|nr:hypothetical protein [uncultured Sphingomonas sp.]